MRTRMRFVVPCVLAFALPWGAPSGARAEPQEASKPEPFAPVQPNEAAPTGKKYTNVYDQLEMQGFSVALLLGEVHGASATDNVPDGAKKALADLREFLPYKSYRLLDTQWIRCCAGPNVTGRLRGMDEQQYAFQMGISGIGPQKLIANFSLMDANFDLQAPRDKKHIISSNFSMETGETIVIGTSSLKGDKALVVLLSAVPRSPISKTKKGSVK